MECIDHERLLVQVVYADFSMEKPLAPKTIKNLHEAAFYSNAYRVPVFRIFGPTASGQKALVHIHGILPYFYIRCENDERYDDTDALKIFMPQLVREVEEKWNLHAQTSVNNKRNRIAHIIAKVCIVRGIPFYGYHHEPKLFLQLFIYNPQHTSKLVQLLRSGNIFGQVMQTFESHYPFLLQIFSDYHIEGMNYLSLSNMTYRQPSSSELDVSTNPKVSMCDIELDVAVASLLNPNQVDNSSNAPISHVPSLAALWEEERHRRISAGQSPSPSLPHSMMRDDDDKISRSPSSSYTRQMQDALQKVLEHCTVHETVSDHTLDTRVPQSNHFPDSKDSQECTYSQLQQVHDEKDTEIVEFLLELHQRDIDEESNRSSDFEEADEALEQANSQCDMMKLQARPYISVLDSSTDTLTSQCGILNFTPINLRAKVRKTQVEVEQSVTLTPKKRPWWHIEKDETVGPSTNLYIFPPPPFITQSQLQPVKKLVPLPITDAKVPLHIRNSLYIPAKVPPDTKTVRSFLQSSTTSKPISIESHVTSDTQPSHSPNLTILSLEMLAYSRGKLLPDPKQDAVAAIGYAVSTQHTLSGLLYHSPTPVYFYNIELLRVDTEKDLFHALIQLIIKYDPDFIVGYEIEKDSLGYLIERANIFNIHLAQEISRIPTSDPGIFSQNARIIGRHVLNLWRIVRTEHKCERNSLEYAVQTLLHRHWPTFSPSFITNSLTQSSQCRHSILQYILQAALVNLEILDHLQFFTQTSEMAKLFGIDFFSVLSRGSQFRVEAVMIRVTKRFNYVMLSPSREQVAGQAPMECIPLVMEPQSGLYRDPVVVLDFQSLYPSIIIAYNLCYSTCLGRMRLDPSPEIEPVLGVIPYSFPKHILSQCGMHSIIAPNGALFCPESHRKGVLVLILEEILRTRIMIKHAMKNDKILHARQLALKLIANVTYGYTAAGFSGRMPCAQLADAIVQYGRATLEAAVRMVESSSQWNARVIYGDTDSLFVLLPDRARAQAFSIGADIARAVTKANPKPIKLKLEKVFMGCFLVSKKRYVGYKYESNTSSPELDAKGLEMVRRDSCKLVQQVMRLSLELLFQTGNIGAVQRAIKDVAHRMNSNQIPLTDYIFAKSVRLGTYADEHSAPPAAIVSLKAMRMDPRAEPRFAQRVPYLVVYGAPNARLMDNVISPNEFVENTGKYAIHLEYYAEKQIIPSLERLFLLMNVRVRDYFPSFHRKSFDSYIHDMEDLFSKPKTIHRRIDSHRIDSYYQSLQCYLCNDRVHSSRLCDRCQANPQQSLLQLQKRLSHCDKSKETLAKICFACTNGLRSFRHQNCQSFSCIVWNNGNLITRNVNKVG